MNKLIFPAFLMAFAIGITSCETLNDDNAITPTYKENSTGTGANPNIGNVTVTGSATLTNPATQNSAIQVGGSGWSFDACVVNGTVLKGTLLGTDPLTEVTLTFGTAPAAGNYSLTNTAPSGNLCRIVINNSPGQPGGITWYSKSGLVTVTTNTTTTPTTINASFCNVQCLQQTFLFPVVTACGYLVCQ